MNINNLAKKTEGFSGSDLKRMNYYVYFQRVVLNVHLDLCVSAALDSVKENMVLPWASRHPQSSQAATATIINEEKTEGIHDNLAPSGAVHDDETGTADPLSNAQQEIFGSSELALPSRTLYLQHFTQALKEITPSSSETLGSLADLRKWNEEFGEGRRNRRRQVWGKGRFGFVDGQDPIVEDGRVAK